MPSLEIANNVICAQLSQMFRVVTLLQNGREDLAYNSPDIVTVALSLIQDFTFTTVKDGDLYDTTFFKSDNCDEQCGLPLTCKCKRQPINPENDIRIDQLAIHNSETLVQFYSQVLIAYYNSLCNDNEPTFGLPLRQIPFAPPGATQNQAFWNVYKYQFITSMNSFAKLISVPYSVYIRPINMYCTAFIQCDLVGIGVYVYPTDTTFKHIEP